MSQANAEALRFKMFFTWGGVVVALMGLVLLATGTYSMGLLLTVAGMLSWLFAKRRTRVVERSQS